MHDVIKKVDSIIDELKKGFIEKYGYTIFNIKTRKQDKSGEIILSGECLTTKQLNLLKRKINKLHDVQKVFYDIDVLTQARFTTDTVKWGKAEKKIVDVTADYEGTKLSTQITSDDKFFKVALRNSDKSLIILDDMTTGWVDNKDVCTFKKVVAEDLDEIKRAGKDKILPVVSLAPLFEKADYFIDRVEYLRGGRSVNGIDCSALVQILFKRAFGIIMPRHTTSQMKCGVRVSKNDIKSGDLIFARLKDTNVMHVGIANFGNEKTIIHACLREKQVISEDIDVFFDHYSFAGARRIVAEKK